MNMFSTVQIRAPKKSKFNLSHEKKLSLQMGKLVPILCTEILPGDSFRVKTEILARFAPMLAPVMHRVNVWTHYFFVPNRLIWDEWESFITGGPDGTDAPVEPFFYPSRATDPTTDFSIGSLADYMGIPVDMITSPLTDTQNYSALPLRAYREIWYQYFRDQNVNSATEGEKTSGLISIAECDDLLALRERYWQKDYFTSALPWEQRGPQALMPMEVQPDYKFPSEVRNIGGALLGGSPLNSTAGTFKANATDAYLDNLNTLENSTISINDFRSAMRLQEWLEKNARGGSRYVEQILSHFGVKSKDSRLQRPEYLGGGIAPVTMSEVLNTTGTTGELPQGNMAGHGISVGSANGFKRSFTEHGFVIGVMSIIPKTAYQQGIHRMWTQRNDRFNYYWPEFAHLGEQPIYDNEVYYDDSLPNDETIFGYTPRYAEYKFINDSVHGEFRTSLDFWHMGRIFASKPALNNAFMKSDPTKRIFAVTDADTEDIYVQLYNRIDALRPMPYYGTPRL